MPQVTLTLSLEELKNILFQLPPQDLLELMAALEERVETLQMMVLAETGFREWHDEGEDIYNAEA